MTFRTLYMSTLILASLASMAVAGRFAWHRLEGNRAEASEGKSAAPKAPGIAELPPCGPQPGGTLRFGRDLRGTPLSDREAYERSHPVPAVRVGEPTLCLAPPGIVAQLLVENPSPKALELIVHPYGGTFPHGGETPFTLAFASHDVTYSGPLSPPEPPLPMAITLPPRTTVAFPASLDLSAWSWHGRPTVELEWGFERLEHPTRGRLRLTLPAR
jgi:hypothetical protein